MVSIDEFRKSAMSFPDATEEPHFEKISFRIKKKIFASFDGKNNQAVLKLNEIDQSVFCASSENIFYVRPEMFEDALIRSYENVAAKKK